MRRSEGFGPITPVGRQFSPKTRDLVAIGSQWGAAGVPRVSV